MGDRIAVMRQGRIVQCGPPLELYEHPVDLFVGQFIGSPSMNVLEATVIGTPDAPALRVGMQSVALDDVALARLPVVRRLVGGRVAFGVRPEALHRDEAGSLVASVSCSERLGPDQLVHATIGAASVRPTERGTWTDHRARSPIIVAMGSAIDINVWEPLTLRVDTTQIHLFDLSTGVALRYMRSAAGYPAVGVIQPINSPSSLIVVTAQDGSCGASPVATRHREPPGFTTHRTPAVATAGGMLRCERA